MFKTSSFKTALSFSNRSINHFGSQIKRQKELLQIIRTALPAVLASHVLHSLLTEKKLLIYTDSAVWAAQLRFYDKAVLAALAPALKNSITIVQIKLLTDPIGPSINQAGTANVPAPEKLAAIRSLCLAAPDNELTIALLKLTKTLEHLTSAE